MAPRPMHSVTLVCLAALFAGCQTPPPTSPEVVREYRKRSGYLMAI